MTAHGTLTLHLQFSDKPCARRCQAATEFSPLRDYQGGLQGGCRPQSVPAPTDVKPLNIHERHTKRGAAYCVTVSSTRQKMPVADSAFAKFAEAQVHTGHAQSDQIASSAVLNEATWDGVSANGYTPQVSGIEGKSISEVMDHGVDEDLFREAFELENPSSPRTLSSASLASTSVTGEVSEQESSTFVERERAWRAAVREKGRATAGKLEQADRHLAISSTRICLHKISDAAKMCDVAQRAEASTRCFFSDQRGIHFNTDLSDAVSKIHEIESRVAWNGTSILSSGSTHAKQSSNRAYVCLLHGNADSFFAYALVVGHQLKKLCSGGQDPPDRVLLCAGHWWANRSARAALRQFFTHVRRVRLIHAPHATHALRHAWVFTKIQALRLPYKHLLLLDLDLVVRGDLRPLFDVQAPAGMFHGHWRGHIEHGQIISETVVGDESWCVNAGVMRLDPRTTHTARRRHVDSMVDRIRKIGYKSPLPEQYFLVEQINGWRHISQRWNMEVGMQYDDPDSVWPLADAQLSSSTSARRGESWWSQKLSEVVVFHFSGTRLCPWWYTDISPEKAYDEAFATWRHRDPRRLIATAVYEWRLALDEVLKASTTWRQEDRQCVEGAIGRLHAQARSYRVNLDTWFDRPRKCHHCNLRFKEDEGRWLWGQRSLWLCADCTVEYIFGEDEPPVRY